MLQQKIINSKNVRLGHPMKICVIRSRHILITTNIGDVEIKGKFITEKAIALFKDINIYNMSYLVADNCRYIRSRHCWLESIAIEDQEQCRFEYHCLPMCYCEHHTRGHELCHWNKL